MSERLAVLRSVEAELQRTLELLEYVEREMVLPAGSGVFLGIKWDGRVLVERGGIVVEEELEEVKERLKKRLELVKKEIEKLVSGDHGASQPPG